MNFSSSKKLSRGTVVTVQLSAASPTEPPTVQGKVLRGILSTRSEASTQEPRYRYGMQFDPGTEELATQVLTALHGRRPPSPRPASTSPAPTQRPWWRRLWPR